MHGRKSVVPHMCMARGDLVVRLGKITRFHHKEISDLPQNHIQCNNANVQEMKLQKLGLSFDC